LPSIFINIFLVFSCILIALKASIFAVKPGTDRKLNFVLKVRILRQSLKPQEELLGGTGMELPPELDSRCGQGAVEDLEAVDLGVMGRAARDDQPFPGSARLSVMHVQALGALGFLADLARVTVALEDFQAKAGKEEEIPPFGRVTARVRASQERPRGAAGAAP